MFDSIKKFFKNRKENSSEEHLRRKKAFVGYNCYAYETVHDKVYHHLQHIDSKMGQVSGFSF